jgi:signal transduction histidine kinase/PAS domain-containing protein
VKTKTVLESLIMVKSKPTYEELAEKVRLLEKEVKQEQKATEKPESDLNRLMNLLQKRNTELKNISQKLESETEKRKSVEELLEREHTTLDNIIEYNPYSIAIANAEGRYVKTNKAYENMFGRLSDLSAYSLFEDPFLKRMGFDKLYRKLYDGEMKILRMKEVWYNPHESDPGRFPDVDRCLSVVNFPLFNPEEKVEFIVLMVEDITERKTAEKALKEERKKLVMSLKHKGLTAEVAYRLNTGESFEENAGKILDTLSRTMEIDDVSFYRFDTDHDYLLKLGSGISSAAQVSATENERLSCARISGLIAKITSSESPFIFDFRKLGEKDRRFFPGCRKGESLIIPIRLRGEALGFVSLGHLKKHDWSREETELFKTIADIIANAWERQRQFQARLEAEKEQIEAVKMAEQASRLASIGVMAAGITHEINQPLTVANFATDWLKSLKIKSDLALPDLFGEKVDLISRSVNRINEIIEHMRSFWVAPDHSMKRQIDLNESVNSAVSLLERQMYSHGIELEINLSSKPLSIQGNPVHLEQTVTNLVVNAMHALDITGKNNKKIRLETHRKKNEAILIVEDNGTGLEIDSVDNIFNPFYSTKKPGKGTGLGLAIVKRFVDEHSGSITVQSRKAAGVKVTVKLPVFKKAKA